MLPDQLPSRAPHRVRKGRQGEASPLPSLASLPPLPPAKKWCVSKNKARNGRKNVQFLVRNGRSPMASVKGLFGR